MKKITSLILTLALLSNSALACDFSKDIKENQDGTYTYTRPCHIEVGKKVKGYSLLETEVKELRLALEHKDLAIIKQEERIKLWMDTSFEVQEKLMKYEKARDAEKYLHFATGVVFTGLAVWGASKLVK